MSKLQNNPKRAKGRKPSTVGRQAAPRANGAALGAFAAPSRRRSKAPPPPAPRLDAAARRPSTAPAAPDRPARPPAARHAPPPPMGEQATRAGGPGGTLIGGVARTRGGFSPASSARVRPGDLVRNASGRGVWGKGTVIAVVPPDVFPWHWCRRHKIPQVFRRDCAPSFSERYVVRGDDGELHAPGRVEVVRGRRG